MKGSHFLHFLLLVALCAGQLASSAHIIGHLHQPADQSGDHHDASHQDSHDHHQHLSFVHRNAELTRPAATDHDKPDCSIFHIYIGLSAIAASYSIEITTAVLHIADARPDDLVASKLSSEWLPIRGPPGIS